MAQTMVEHHFEQGMEQGRIEEKQSDVLKLLQHRFDALPESLSGEIASIRSLSRLDALFEEALTATTLDEIDLQDLGD